MTDYDQDRIADLVSGSLDPAEAAALEAEIARDPRAAAELAAQRFARDALRATPAPVLSADERAELHRAVAAALHLDESPQPVATTTRRRVPWRPLAVAAATLAALVVAVPLFGLLSVGDNEAAMTTIALEATTEARDTAVATAGDEAENFGAQSEEADGMLGAATTTAAATTTLVTPLAREMTDADKAVADLIADPALLFEAAPAAAVPCGEEARLLLHSASPTGVLLPPEAGGLAAWFLSSDGETVQRLLLFDPATCQFLAAHP